MDKINISENSYTCELLRDVNYLTCIYVFFFFHLLGKVGYSNNSIIWMLKVFRKRRNIFTNLKISKNVWIFMNDIIRIIKIKLTNWTLSILYMHKFDPIFHLIHEQNIQKLHRNCVKERYNRATLINWFVCIRNLWHTYYSYYITHKLNLNREINKSNFQRNFPIEIRFFEIETNFLAINICKFLWPTVTLLNRLLSKK